MYCKINFHTTLYCFCACDNTASLHSLQVRFVTVFRTAMLSNINIQAHRLINGTHLCNSAFLFLIKCFDRQLTIDWLFGVKTGLPMQLERVVVPGISVESNYKNDGTSTGLSITSANAPGSGLRLPSTDCIWLEPISSSDAGIVRVVEYVVKQLLPQMGYQATSQLQVSVYIFYTMVLFYKYVESVLD